MEGQTRVAIILFMSFESMKLMGKKRDNRKRAVMKSVADRR